MKFGDYELNTIVVPAVGTNCYILSLGNKAILVDAAGDGQYLYKYISEKKYDITTILITHGHYDHIQALDYLCDKFPSVKIYASEKEKEVIENEDYSLLGYRLKESTEKAIVYLKDTDIIKELGLDIEILITPGHTIGSSCYLLKDINVLFSGDTLFRETYGRTDLATGDIESIVDSIVNRLMKLNDDLLVLPGHGFRTTIGFERTHNLLIEEYIK